MSSILDALKKLENEKITRDPQHIRISSEILKDGSLPRQSPLRSFWIVLLIFMCGGAATYVYLNASALQTVTTQPTPQTISKIPPASRESAGITPPAAVQAERIEPETIVPARPVRQAKSATAVLVHPAKPDNHGTTHRPANQPEKATSTGTTTVRTTLTSVPATPITRLRVNGIAFQDGPESVAVVNGTPVSRGTVIEGARVDDIRPDRVRFSKNGKTFDIPLGASNQ